MSAALCLAARRQGRILTKMEQPHPGTPSPEGPPPLASLAFLKLPPVHTVLPNATWQLLTPPPWREAVVLADVIQPDVPAMLYNGAAQGKCRGPWACRPHSSALQERFIC